MIAGRARALSLAALALSLALATAARSDSDEPGRIRALTGEFIARRLARPPLVARRGGPYAGERIAPLLATGALAAERVWLGDFRRRLDAERPGTPLGARALLEAAVELEALELETRRPFERDPGAYVSLVAGSVEAALGRPGSSCVAARDAARRLAEVPEILRAARVNLKDPPRLYTERAIERFGDVLRFYREDVPRLAAGCRSPRTQADLAQADSTAVRAVEAFIHFLEENLLPASQGEPWIGPEASRRLVGAMLMAAAAPVETLLAESERLLEARRAELDAAAASMSAYGAAAGTRAVLDSLARIEPGTVGPITTTGQSVERVRAFLRERKLMNVPSRLNIKVRPASRLRATPAPRLAASDPAIPRGNLAWLETAARDTLAGAGVGGAGRARFDPREVDLAVAHEGLPGRLARELPPRGEAPRVDLALADLWPGDDWGELCERILIEEGFGAGDARYRLALALRALRRAGRSLAALGLHSGAMSIEDARRVLEERCLFEPAESERAVRSIAAEPATMGYTIGAQRWLELRDDARRRLGPRYRTRAFIDAVLRGGVAPCGFVRDRLWHELGAAGAEPVGAGP